MRREAGDIAGTETNLRTGRGVKVVPTRPGPSPPPRQRGDEALQVRGPVWGRPSSLPHSP